MTSLVSTSWLKITLLSMNCIMCTMWEIFGQQLFKFLNFLWVNSPTLFCNSLSRKKNYSLSWAKVHLFHVLTNLQFFVYKILYFNNFFNLAKEKTFLWLHVPNVCDIFCSFNKVSYIHLLVHTQHQCASKFIMCFILFWMKLNKFSMVKVATPL